MESTKKELANIVYDYSMNKKYVDKIVVERLLKLCIDEFDISDYVRDYRINSIAELKNARAAYRIEDKSIDIDIYNTINTILKRIEKEENDGICTTNFVKYLKVNLDLVHVIIHELTHACQYKRCLEKENDLEKNILELTLKGNLDVLKNKNLSKEMIKFYNIQHDIFLNPVCYKTKPCERMAEMKGLEFVRDMSKMFDIDAVELYFEIKYLMGKIRGYSDISPTSYVIHINESLKNELGLPHGETDCYKIEDEYKKECEKRNVSFDDRLYFGFPIDKNDMEQINDKIKTFKKKLFL